MSKTGYFTVYVFFHLKFSMTSIKKISEDNKRSDANRKPDPLSFEGDFIASSAPNLQHYDITGKVRIISALEAKVIADVPPSRLPALLSPPSAPALKVVRCRKQCVTLQSFTLASNTFNAGLREKIEVMLTSFEVSFRVYSKLYQ